MYRTNGYAGRRDEFNVPPPSGLTPLIGASEIVEEMDGNTIIQQ